MNKHFFLLLASFYFSIQSFAIHIDYKLSMSKPNSHYFDVEMNVSDLKAKELVIKMPVWAPGSYLVREFSKAVDIVTATDENGNALDVVKSTKNTWVIQTKKISKVKISYHVYAFELSVRTSFLDDSHGYLNGSSVFMYVDGQKETAGKLEIIPHSSFKKISTILTNEGGNTFSFKNYDELVDSPIEIGNHKEFSFTAANTNHRVAMYGEGNYDEEQLKKDMAKVIEAETKIFNVNPNKEYLFIIHNVTDPAGGLEHKASTTLQVNRWTYGDDYIGFLSLVAHEYFHLWNVKRIRPKELGPFDYDHENYTDLLWVMEGFTSYYDELILRRCGYYTEDDYVNKIMGVIGYVENQPGNKVQPVAHSSFDAWIKAYQPNENSVNTGISYYSKGQILACMLDLYIINKFKAEKSLDDFMLKLFNDFYIMKDVGFTEEEFQSTLESFLGEDMDWFFNDYVYGTKTIDYTKFFAGVGLDVRLNKTKAPAKPYLGIRTSDQGGRLIVTTVMAGSAAEEQGISVNDEIIAINGYRMDGNEFTNMTKDMKPGDQFEVMLSRDNLIKNYTITMGAQERDYYTHEPVFTPEQKKNFDYWLRITVK
ncbi:MAG: PDZ domain-containing protein [Crocinitomicaceae bacterium]